jgi:glucokinase
VLEEQGLRGSLDFASVHLLKDLVAMAYANPQLGADSLATLQAGRPVPAVRGPSSPPAPGWNRHF